MALLPLLFFVIVTGAAGLPYRRSTDHTVCETEACRKMGESIQQSIDKSVDPCTDFYAYACGLWSEHNPSPPSELEWSTIHEIIAKTNLRFKEILEEESEYDNLEPIKMLKKYYNTCMDLDAIEKLGLEPMQAILDANGGWPILLENPESNIGNYTWQDIDDTYIEKFTVSSFYTFSFIPEEDDASQNLLAIEQGIGSFVESELIKRDANVFPYLNKIDRVITVFKKHKGIETPRDDFITYVEELYNFEVELRNMSAYEKAYKVQGGLKNDQDRMTIAELQEYYDQAETQNSTAQINWLKMIQALLKPINKTIDSSYPVVVINKHLFHKLAHLLDATPSRVIVSYIHWNLVSGLLPYLTKEIRDIDFETSNDENNLIQQKPRWETCASDIQLEHALGFLFIKKFNSPNTITAVTEMLNDLKVEMKERILNSKWTIDNAKNFMIEKIDNLASLIGYPDWYNNQTAFVEQYKGLEIGESYLHNVIASVQYGTYKQLEDSLKPVDRYKWPVSPTVVNAFYTGLKNLLVIPAAEIQDPFFTPEMPLAVNYGAVGMTIGHELAHSFDTTGFEFDKVGNKIMKDNETIAAYEERVKCFIDQYDNFTILIDEDENSLQVSGQLTKDENVADNIGLEAAFEAFQKRKQIAGPQSKLPGLLDISDEKLFFLSFANTWCTATTDQIAIYRAYVDDHSPNKFRVLGTVANMESFSNAFNCSVNSSLNRESKCTLWK